MDVRQQCPRCGTGMQVRYVRIDRTGEWGWVWTCPECRREIPVPKTDVNKLDHM